MAKPKIIKNKNQDLINFGHMEWGENFLHGGQLYTKIKSSGERDNAFNHETNSSRTIEGSQLVQQVSVEMRIL